MLPEKTYFISIYYMDGELSDTFEFVRYKDALDTLKLFVEPTSAELYSQINLTEYNWVAHTETTLATITFPKAN